MLLKGAHDAVRTRGVVGIATSFLFVYITQYYTEYKYRPVQSIAKACLTGPATTIISGFAHWSGMRGCSVIVTRRPS